MPRQHWTAVEELFGEVASLAPGAREALLDSRRRHEPRVVEEVESLLAHASVGSFLRTAVAFVAPGEARQPEPASSRIGRVLDHYRLKEFIGAGGMGEVFRAEDLALGREAALKLLPRNFSPELRAVLLREADACARLQHPGMATFYESGEADGETFIAMEFVPGRSLRARLREGPLAVGEALAVARRLLAALGHAHAAGVVHRDIKPENIIITPGGEAKLLDFGIAARVVGRPATRAGHDGSTSEATAVGTPGYLAPEQLFGEPFDARADLFQLGLVLFEMIAGRPAFPGSSRFERLAALARGSVDFDVIRRADPPAGLIAILQRALAREPSHRYPTASAFLRDLENLDHTPAALPPTLAILDLENAGGDPGDDWIGSGLAESVGADLTRVSGLQVIAREKVLRAVGARRGARASNGVSDPADIGRLLGCRWVLSGRFRRAGESLELEAAVTDAASGEIVARETVEGALESIHPLKDALCRAILRGLDVDTPPIGGAGPHVNAFECYARARRLFHRLDKGTLDEARELYERAVELDPTYAWALSGLAGVYAMRFPFRTDAQDLERAAEYARRAIAADPKLSDPHAWLSYALMRQERMEEALEAAALAERLDPLNVFAPYYAGCVHCFSGRPAQAVAPLQRALAIDASHGFAWMILGGAHLSLANLAAARWCFERAVALERAGVPGAPVAAGAYIAECLRLEGVLEEARKTCLEAIETAERSDHMYRDTYRGIALCCLARIAFDRGDVPAARAALTQVLAHVRGRDRMLGGGHLAVQALAGLARAGDGAPSWHEAHTLFAARPRFNFSVMGGCDDATSLHALAQAAMVLGLPEAQGLLARAAEAGAYEARVIMGPG